MKHLLLCFGIVLCLPISVNAQATSDGTESNGTEVVLASEIQWEQLNPARGDASPQAANVWGDRKQPGETGFLVKFVDGFSSPPHIHNVTYRGIVLRGLVHNDDPDAANMWMPKGSYWTQPAGEAHITSAKGQENIAYIEIAAGPYLVRPVEEAFDEGERPVNVDPSNLVWLDGSGTQWIRSKSSTGPTISFLWGQPGAGQVYGALLNIPAGVSGSLACDDDVRVVIIDGTVNYQATKEAVQTALAPGSYLGSTGNKKHRISCNAASDCMVYIRSSGTYRFRQDSSSN